MAEIGIAASLIGITSAAISLTRTLYLFGSTTSAARDQVDYIAKNVSFYSDVLDLLVEQFECDRPIHSRKALTLAEKLHDHSYDLFDRIRDLIPDRKRSRDQFSFIQRIAWNFKKTRVDFLVGELENLKSTVQLLVQVLCAARQIHAYQTDGAKSDERKRKKKREAVNRQCRRAENVIVEWQRTQENLLVLREAADQNDLPSIQAVGQAEKPAKAALSKDFNALVRINDTTLAVIDTATSAAVGSESDKRALVLQNTADWLEQLINEWTVPPSRSAEGHQSAERPSSRGAVHNNWTASPVNETVKDGPGIRGQTSTSERLDKDKVDSEVLQARLKLQELELLEERHQRKLAEDETELLRRTARRAQDPIPPFPGPNTSRTYQNPDPESGMPQASAARAIPDQTPERLNNVTEGGGGRRASQFESKTQGGVFNFGGGFNFGDPNDIFAAFARPGAGGSGGGEGGGGSSFRGPSGLNGRGTPERRSNAKPEPDSYHDSNSKYARKRDSGYAGNSGRQSKPHMQSSKPVPHERKRYQYVEDADEEEDEDYSDDNYYHGPSVFRRKSIPKTSGPDWVEAAGMSSDSGDSMTGRTDGVPGRRSNYHIHMRSLPLSAERLQNWVDKT